MKISKKALKKKLSKLNKVLKEMLMEMDRQEDAIVELQAQVDWLNRK